MPVKALAIFLLLVACVPEADPDPESQDGGTMSAAEIAACHAEFGEVISNGWNIDICQRPLVDGGMSCSTGSDCEGMCLAETRQCSSYAPMFGCFPIIEDGEEVTICFE